MPTSFPGPERAALPDEAEQALAKASRRLLPLLFVLYVAAYLDRVNVSFAALHMNRDLGLSDAAYGLGAGIFFLGYVLFEIPSNLIMERVGARRWIARIAVSWGLVSASMALVHAEAAFLVLRFLLGVAEAGFLPGVILYLTSFFPRARRATAVSLFMSATAVAGLVGAPLSGAILGLHGAWDVAGWRWLFLLEGIPALLLGFVVLRVLPDRPGEAPWLTAGEKAALAAVLAAEAPAPGPAPVPEESAPGPVPPLRVRLSALARPEVWLLSATYFCMVVAMYGLGMWMPQIISRLDGGSDLRTGFLTALPYLCAAVGMCLAGRRADRSGRGKAWTLGCLVLAMVGVGLAGLSVSLVPCLAGFCLAATGIWGMLGPFWGLATARMAPAAAAAGIAWINSVGNVGGFVGPTLMGWFKSLFDGYSPGLLALAAALALGAACLAPVRPAPVQGEQP